MTTETYTDQQIRAVASALRAQKVYTSVELDAADVIEQLYRERGELAAVVQQVAQYRDEIRTWVEAQQVGGAEHNAYRSVYQKLNDVLNEVAW